MDPAERLTAYLDGQLTPDEHAAVEAELVTDPRLRAALADLQRADAALDGASPTSLPAGADDRLRSRLRPVLEETTGPDTPATSDDEPSLTPGPVGDELSARRASRWQAPLAVAAAVVGVLVVGGVVVSGLQDDAADEVASMDGPADAEIMEDSADDVEQPDMETEEAPEADAGDEAALAGALPDAPTVVDEDADLDDDRVEAILEGEELQRVRDLALGSPEGDEIAAAWQRELGVPADPPDERAEDDAFDAPAGEEPPVTRSGEPLEDRAAADLARCLEDLLDPGVTAIPAYVELGTFDGAAALLVGMVTVDPDTSTFTRSEVWVIDRASCEVLHFEQQ